jgi:hypothetical protein
MSSSSAGLMTPLLVRSSAGSSTGASLIAGVAVSMRGVCVDTAGDVLCGKVPLRETGEMGSDVGGGADVVVVMLGGDMGVADAMLAAWLSGGGSSTRARTREVYRCSTLLAQG